MPSIQEATGAPSPFGADVQTGVEALSYSQTITFTQYIRLVLPLDGYVFWVRSDLVSTSALLNAFKLNSVAFNQPPTLTTAAPTLTVTGSLHYATDMQQEEDKTIAVNSVVFTAQSPVQDLNVVGPYVLYIGEFQGQRFAFSSRGSFYQQADLWHYRGDAIYPDMQTQIVDSLTGFDTKNVIVSNSLPIWLSLNGYAQRFGPYSNFTMMLFPSFLVPANLPPPFAAVHVDPGSTRALAAAPTLDSRYTHSQLVKERVKITLYGMRNFNALDFVDLVNQYSLDFNTIGIMNMPVVQDEKRTQAELSTIAMKKTIEYEVNYYQERANDIARQLILNAVPSFNFLF